MATGLPAAGRRRRRPRLRPARGGGHATPTAPSRSSGDGELLLPTPGVARRAADLLRAYGATRVLVGAAMPLGLLAPGPAPGRGRDGRRAHPRPRGLVGRRCPGARAALRRVGDACDHLTTISDYTARRIAPALSPAARPRLLRLPPPVDLDVFRPAGPARPRPTRDPDRRGGRPLRRPEGLRRPAAGLARRGRRPRAPAGRPRLVLVGDGPQGPRLRRLADAPGPRGHGDLHRARWPPAGVAGRLRTARRLRAAGPDPAGPASTPRASAWRPWRRRPAGCPVLVGDSGGAPETVLDGVTGRVLPSDDVGGLDPGAPGAARATRPPRPRRGSAGAASSRNASGPGRPGGRSALHSASTPIPYPEPVPGQTSSSVAIDAEPDAVMAVIADFDALPRLGRLDGAGHRPAARPTAGPTRSRWCWRTRCSPTPTCSPTTGPPTGCPGTSSAAAASPRWTARTSSPPAGADDRHLHARGRHLAADDRAAAPQGREDDRRRRAPRPQASGRRLSTTRPAGVRQPRPRDHPAPAGAAQRRRRHRRHQGRGRRGRRGRPGARAVPGAHAVARPPGRRGRDRRARSSRLRERHAVEAVGIGAAGWVDNTQSVVRFSPHLAWRDEPLRAALGRPRRPAADRRQRRERGRLGRVPLRRRRRRRR